VSHPEFNVSDSLGFLTTQYPDTSEWIVDSGVAIEALAGKREQPPEDIDIVSHTADMEADFGEHGSSVTGDRRYIDVKSVDHWLERRSAALADPTALWPYIVALSSAHEIKGHTVRVMHPAIIAATKSTMARMEQRSKDVADLELLAVSPEQLHAATELLKGHDPDLQFGILQQRS